MLPRLVLVEASSVWTVWRVVSSSLVDVDEVACVLCRVSCSLRRESNDDCMLLCSFCKEACVVVSSSWVARRSATSFDDVEDVSRAASSSVVRLATFVSSSPPVYRSALVKNLQPKTYGSQSTHFRLEPSFPLPSPTQTLFQLIRLLLHFSKFLLATLLNLLSSPLELIPLTS